MTHAELLADRRSVPGLGPSTCPGRLVTVEGPVHDQAGEAVLVEILRCQDCGARIALEPRTNVIRNVYVPHDPKAFARSLAKRLDATPMLPQRKEEL